MKTILLLVALLTISTTALAQPDFNEVVDAIYKTEGSEKAKKPFGILSVKCEGYDECRQICYNTVKNNWRRWENKTHGAEKYNDYLSFLASRYAPIGVKNDPTNLNKNWVRLVKYFYSLN